MGEPTEESRLVEEQLRRIAAARQQQQQAQYRDDLSLQQMNQDHLDAIQSSAQLYARQGALQDERGRPQLPGSSQGTMDLLRQMTQYRPGDIDRSHTAQLRGQQQLAMSQPAADVGGLHQDSQWTALQSLMSNFTQQRAVVDHATRDSLQMHSQRIPARMESPSSISHALQDLRSQSQPHAAMPPSQFNPIHTRAPPTSTGQAWPESMPDASQIDSRHQSSAGLSRASLSLSHGQAGTSAPAVDHDFSTTLASMRPQMHSAQPTHALAARDASQAPQPPAQALSEGTGTVLAAKVLTESDVKHSRAILPRVAVENNLPFLLGYRTFGIYIPDEAGTQWEFVVKSWANGRTDKSGQTIKRKDRRVYVVEQMSKYLAKHRLGVGDIVGFVHVDGHLEVHCQTTALKSWIDRPTYGPPPLEVYPSPVPGKCTLLEEQPGDTSARCQRTPGCPKPDQHLGPCETPSGATRTSTALGAQKLKLWPQPDAQDPPEELSDPASLPELQPADLLDGALVNFRVARSTLDTGTAHMPSGHVIKVPEALADSPAMRLRVRVDGAGTYTVILAVAPRDQSEPVRQGDPGSPDGPADAAGGGIDAEAAASAAFAAAAGIDPAAAQPIGQLPGSNSARPWRILGLGDVLNAVHCSEADELCVEKEQDSVLVHRLASTHLPPVPPANPAVAPPLPSTFTMNLCQRTQGCMKAENHTGFCSGHRGFKRKNTAPYGSGGDELGAPPRRRKPMPGTAKARQGPPATRDDLDWVPGGRGHGSQISDASARWRRDARISAEAIMGMPNLPNGTLGTSPPDLARQLPGTTGLGSLSHHTVLEQERDLQLQLQQQQQQQQQLHAEQLLRQQIQEAQQQPQQSQQHSDMDSNYLTMVLQRELWRQQQNR